MNSKPVVSQAPDESLVLEPEGTFSLSNSAEGLAAELHAREAAFGSDAVYSAYVKVMTGVLAAGLLVVMLLNVIVDPYEFFGSPEVRGINKYNSDVNVGGQRRTKSLQMKSHDYMIVIGGSSRVMRSIDPDSEVFEGRPAYNAGIFGTNMVELEKVLDEALKREDLEQIYLGLDFLMFSTGRGYSGDMLSSGFAGVPKWKILLESTVSADALAASIDTLEINRKSPDQGAYLSEDGFVIDERESKPALPYRREKFDAMLSKNFMIDPETYAAFQYDPNRMRMLKSILMKCQEKGVGVTLFLPPVHARQLETIDVMGLWPVFEFWKKDLVEVVASGELAEARVSLYDFTGYDIYTTEPIPPYKSTKDMVYWSESSHAREALGELVLQRLTGHGASDLPEDFGVLLTAENIASHLETVRREREVYIAENPDERRAVLRLYHQTAPERFRNRLGSGG